MILIWSLLLISSFSLALRWESTNHHIQYNKSTYNIRGINWFGLEGDCLFVQGLWIHNLDYYFSFLKANGFNSVRVPFSDTIVFQLDQKIKWECVTEDAVLQSLTIKDAIHHFFGMAKFYEISILLDFHTITGKITESVVENSFSYEDFYIVWDIMLHEYGHYSNLIGIDIKNEPHGHTLWPDWGNFVRRFIMYVKNKHPDFQGLFFIEGLEDFSDQSTWGGSFRRMGNYIGTSTDPRIVFSPHVYGVSVRGSRALNDGYYRWNQWFGFLLERYPNAIVIGEMGGYDENEDHQWHENILDYLETIGIRNFYYWCLNPNSFDTNGIFYMDWTSVFQNKIDFCKRLQPNPTFVSYK